MARSIVLAFLLFAVALADPVAAQTVNAIAGAIDGTVVDTSKAVLPGVTVTLSGPAQMGTAVALTNQNGLFRFPVVPLGEYRLAFELSGFGTVIHEGIRISVGFTATVNVEMGPASVAESITVSSQSPVVDLQSTSVRSHFDTQTLESLPGARDVWAIMAVAPAMAIQGRMDVGGSGTFSQKPVTAYGISGGQRNEIEGMLVSEGSGSMYYTDYGSFAEVAVTAVGNTAEVSIPGVYTQLVSKSGGNKYFGTVSYNYENESMETGNIDARQIAAGVAGSKTLDVHDLNRLVYFRDFTADIGGYVKKDKVWWYGGFRDNRVGLRFPTLIDDIQSTWGPDYTAKLTANVGENNHFVGYYQRAGKEQTNFLGAIQVPSAVALQPADTVTHMTWPNYVWKAEYSALLTNALYLLVRGGNAWSKWTNRSKSSVQRFEDVGNNTIVGGFYEFDRTRNRNQVNGSLSYSKNGWGGNHNFKFGGEIMREMLFQPFRGFLNSSQSLSVLNNGIPTQVYLYLPGSQSENNLWASAAYANDTWRLNQRLTLTLGLRFDRYQPYLPAQVGPGGLQFAEAAKILVWKNWGPRLGLSYDLTGNGKTLFKANYGKYWLYPAADFASSANPNTAVWYRQYAWSDLNGSGLWDPGEEGRLLAVQGGTLVTTIDPNLQNTFTHQASVFVEHELAPNFGIRTGLVWFGRRQVSGTVNANRPLDAFNVPVTIRDPGPDGRLGTTDDGDSFTAYNLSPQSLALSPVNILKNLDRTGSDYYTWEITATRRQSAHWSLTASFAETRSDQTAFGAGTSYTPNVLINAIGDRTPFTSWQVKVHAMLELPRSLRVIPLVRHQSGLPFGRTFTQTLNWGNATVRAEPMDAERVPNVTILDVRTEKSFRLRYTKLTGFFDLYNVFNTNAEQAINTTSGSAWLRPTAITGPRVLRVGMTVDW